MPKKQRKPKYLYTLVTPEGHEVVIGAYTSDGAADGALKRKYPADWLSLTSMALRQHELAPGERVNVGERVKYPWTGY